MLHIMEVEEVRAKNINASLTIQPSVTNSRGGGREEWA
jgi:hypothetical protein